MSVLKKATSEDRFNSVEPTGEPTDVFRVMASKTFNVPYHQVTKSQRRAVKSAAYLLRYR